MTISLRATRFASGDDVSLDGPVTVAANTTNTYTITNYDAFSSYVVTTSLGTVSRSVATISLVVPTSPSSNQIVLTVKKNNNTFKFNIAIGASSVVKPSITSPTQAQTNVTVSPTITGTVFTTVPAVADTHASSQWQVSLVSDFTTIAFDSGASTVYKTNIPIAAGVLNPSTTYYARVRYTGTTLGASLWSDARSFTTTSVIVNTPAVSVTGGPSNVGDTPTINTSPFTVTGGSDTHASTDWQILLASDSSVVWQSSGNSTNKTSINIPSGVLVAGTNYIARARHTGAVLGNGAYGSYTFLTMSSFIPTTPGTPYGGGTYVGRFNIYGTVYALVVAPKASGESNFLQIKQSTSLISGTSSTNNGLSNTNALFASGPGNSPAASFVKNLSIGGFTDWAIPAIDQLDLMYRMLKPTADANDTNVGDNPSLSPPGINYTETNPAQTTLDAFKTGGSEALEFAYWSSTSHPTLQTYYWTKGFGSGSLQLASQPQEYFKVRAIRMVPT